MTVKELKEMLEKVDENAIVSFEWSGVKTVTKAYEIIKTEFNAEEPTTTHRLVLDI